MARPLRIERAGVWYHVTARGNERKAIYRSDRDREHFLELLPVMVERFRCRLYAYVLMENHFHLLLETLEENLSRALQWLNVSYSVWFNRRYQRVGHLFQGRFKSVVVEPTVWGLSLSRYLHLNPVRLRRLRSDKGGRSRARHGVGEQPTAELVRQRLQELRRFPWSSYPAYAGARKAPAWLEPEQVLSLGGGRPAQWCRNYRQDCEAAVREGITEVPWDHLKGGLILGSAEFIAEWREKIGPGPVGDAARKALQARPTWKQVIEVIEKLKKESWREFRDRRGDEGRELAMYLGRQYCGLKLQELADQVESGSPMSVSAALKRFAQRLGTTPALARQLREAKSRLNI